MNFEIRGARNTDLLKIVQCHKKAFPTALTSKMGNQFLVRMFDWYLSTDQTFLFFIERSNQVVGYCGGMIIDGTLDHGSASSMTQYTFTAAIKALVFRPWLLLHPDFISRYSFVGRNIFTWVGNKFRKRKIKSVSTPREPYSGLVVIGVDSAFHGYGFGSKLLVEFERITLQKGIKKMMLSVKSTNEQAIRSYSRNGWTVISTNNKSVKMEKNIG